MKTSPTKKEKAVLLLMLFGLIALTVGVYQGLGYLGLKEQFYKELLTPVLIGLPLWLWTRRRKKLAYALKRKNG